MDQDPPLVLPSPEQALERWLVSVLGQARARLTAEYVKRRKRPPR